MGRPRKPGGGGRICSKCGLSPSHAIQPRSRRPGSGFCCQLILHPNGSGKIEEEQQVINIQAIIPPCLSDLLDNVRHRSLNRPVGRGDVEQVPNGAAPGDRRNRAAVKRALLLAGRLASPLLVKIQNTAFQ